MTFARERCITKFCFSLLISKDFFLNVVLSSSTLPSILRRSVSKLWCFVLSSRSDVINSCNSDWIVDEVCSILLHLWAVYRGVRLKILTGGIVGSYLCNECLLGLFVFLSPILNEFRCICSFQSDLRHLRQVSSQVSTASRIPACKRKRSSSIKARH